jgi:protein SCO1/2
MREIKRVSLVLIASLLALNLQAVESGHDNHQHGASAEEDPHAEPKAMMKQPAESAKATRVELLDRVLLDQHGKEVKFVSDVIGDRIVVMDFVYTTCTTVCPVLSAVFAQLQKKLGDRLGDDVVLVSVSVDPVRDTPQRLKAYSRIHKAQPGWIWLTGQKGTMDDVRNGLGAYSPNFEDHAAMVLIGDGQDGQWSRFYGFPNPDRLIERVNALQAARNAVSGG